MLTASFKILLEKENTYMLRSTFQKREHDPVTALHKITRICPCQRAEVHTTAEHQKPFGNLEHTLLPNLIHGHCLFPPSALPQAH